MGRKSGSSSNALALQVDAEAKVKYDAIARQGHRDDRIIHTSHKDLVPLRQRADVGDISLDRPSEEQVQATKEKTQAALAKLVAGASAAQKPKTVQGLTRRDPTFVRYTPADQMGDRSKKQDRIIKIVDRQQDPMEPPKHKLKKIPRGPPSPPPPVMHSPPRKLTAEDQEAWRIPPPISNWKNPKGFTVPLDKRLAADGRGLQDVTLNDKFAQFTESLEAADRAAREEVKMRTIAQQRLAEKEKLAKEDNLRALAQKAREDRIAAQSSQPRRGSSSSSRSRSRSYSGSASGSDDEEAGVRERARARAEQKREYQRKQRQEHMGTERRMQQMARQQDRDISEKVALGLAKPTVSKESMYDSRLFNQTSGFAAGFNEDQAYDKPLFADREALNSIYRNNAGGDDDDEGGAGAEETMDSIHGAKRFETLGRAPKEGFKGASTAEQRSGPVQFVKDSDAVKDPFGLDQMIADAQGAASAATGSAGGAQKRYGLDLPDRDDGSKRARVDDD